MSTFAQLIKKKKEMLKVNAKIVFFYNINLFIIVYV